MKRIFLNVIFCALILWAGQAHALTSGSSTSGSITTVGGVSHQSFSGTAGQGFALAATSSAFNPTVTVYRPNGTLWLQSTARVSSTSLPATGTYDVVISGGPTAIGSYDLAYVRGGDSVCCGSLTSGATLSTTLSANGLLSYEISGTAGEGILLYSGNSGGTAMNIFKPDGTLLAGGNNRVSATLSTTGTYVVTVVGSTTIVNGALNLYYVRGADGVSDGDLASGQPVRSSMSANALKSYKLTATAGQSVVLYTGSSYSINISIYKPDGSYLTYGTRRYANVNLPSTGTYTVVLSGANTTDNGPYNLYYFHSADNVSEGSLLTTKTRLRQSSFEWPREL